MGEDQQSSLALAGERQDDVAQLDLLPTDVCLEVLLGDAAGALAAEALLDEVSDRGVAGASRASIGRELDKCPRGGGNAASVKCARRRALLYRRGQGLE